MLSSKKIVDDYIKKIDWRVNENSNSPYSFGSLNKHIIAEVSKDYWLNEVYKDKRIIDAYKNGDMHIHDLGGLTLYCCGYSLRNIILMGVQGIPNIPTSSPAKHFDAILNQIANLVTIYQNEIMGAVAFNSFDTLLAPYIKKDNLTYEEVKQNLQNFIFSINSNSRAGAEPAFTNITFDLFPPKDLENDPALIGDKIQEFTYKECQKEMDMLNKAFYELMNEGDYNGRPFSYPIPTYNINSNFDFDNPNNECQKEMDMLNKAFYELMNEGDYNGRPFSYPIPTYNINSNFDFDNPNNMLFEMTGKFGYPYFANFVNSDMDQSDVRSMCCRLNLDLRELRKRNGGLFGSGDSTGSIGVVTINLPRLAYKHKNNEKEFFNALKEILIIAKDSLEKKRKWLNDNIINKDMLPAFSTYVGTLKNHFSTIGIVGLNEMCENFNEKKRKWLNDNIINKDMLPAFSTYVGTLKNHFSTIGIVGLNEMCENFNGNNILTEEGMEFSIKVCNFIREELINFQEETGNLYNFEATPAESTCYRLAKKDVEDFEDIIVRGGREYPYYTNSCHMPPNEVKNLKQLFDHQDYRLAKKDVEDFEDIIVRGGREYPYYTNSCHMPPNEVKNLKQLFDHQDKLQVLFTGGTVVHIYCDGAISGEKAKHIVKTVCKKYRTPYVSISPLNRYCELFTGGTVVHIYCDGAISGEKAKHIVKTVCKKYRTPYVSISPLNRYCEEHGYVKERVEECPICGKKLDLYQRITGYLRKVEFFNDGKKSEFKDRNQLSL